jgi:hypothetical protein
MTSYSQTFKQLQWATKTRVILILLRLYGVDIAQ